MMKRLALTAAFALTAGILITAQQADKTEQKTPPSLTGKWTLTLETQAGAMPSELNMKLDGKDVTGTLNSQMGEAPISGQFADGKLNFNLTYQSSNGSGQVTFTGSQKADGSFAGTMDFGGQGLNLPWKAVRVPTAEGATPEPQKNADAPKVPDIAGNWTMALTMEIGNATPALVFKQEADKITGTYTGRYGTYPFKGTIKGREIQFSFTMNTDGGQTTMSFNGEIAADAQTMKGAGSIEGMGDVTWTAKKDK